jgi:uncharacterized membrane protein
MSHQILSPRNSSDADVSATLGAAQDMPEDVTAAGNEPFWRVDIAGGDFTLSRPDFEP